MEDFKMAARQDAIKAFQSDRLLRNGLILILFAVIFFAMAGALAGWALGVFAPDYYRISLHFEKGEADAGQLGIGLGATQGAVAGLIAGCVVVLATAWFKSRVKSIVIDQLEE
jgi:hypothetical protein